MRIVTFNVYWMQGSSFGHTDPPDPRDDVLGAIGALMLDVGADLVCVQEVQSFEAARRLARAVSLPWWYYRPGRLEGREQYGGACFVRDPRWAFMPVDSEPIERAAIKAVRDGDNLCVAGVHLRSNRFAADRDQAATFRRAELEVVLDTEPTPHIVAGDFNAKLDDDLWNVLADRGYVDALAQSGAGKTPTTIGGTHNDRIWLGPDLADRLRSAEVIGPDRLGLSENKLISDHFPVVAELDL